MSARRFLRDIAMDEAMMADPQGAMALMREEQKASRWLGIGVISLFIVLIVAGIVTGVVHKTEPPKPNVVTRTPVSTVAAMRQLNGYKVGAGWQTQPAWDATAGMWEDEDEKIRKISMYDVRPITGQRKCTKDYFGGCVGPDL